MVDTDLERGVKDSPAQREEASLQRAEDLFDREAAQLHLRLLFSWLPREALFCLATARGDRQGSAFRLSQMDHAYGPFSELDQALELAEMAVLAGEDVFVAPHPRSVHLLRREGGWREGRLLWVDLDSPDPEPVPWLLGMGGFVVASGSPGRHHGYLLLERAIPEPEVARLNGRLATALAGDKTKCPTNSLLRLAGTRNSKSGKLAKATRVHFPQAPVPRLVSPEDVEKHLVDLGVPAVELQPLTKRPQPRQPRRSGSRTRRGQRRDPAHRHTIMQSSVLLRTPPEVRTRVSRTGSLLVWWTSPCCGARLGVCEARCRGCGGLVRDEALLMKAAAQHRQLTREFEAAKQGGPVIVGRSRVDGRRPRCPACGKALALRWRTCEGCDRPIDWNGEAEAGLVSGRESGRSTTWTSA